MSENGEYREVFHSTAVLGGARLVTMALGLARSKLVALLLGPVGVGLLGTYEAVTMMAMALAGLGLSTSAVRQVALASNEICRAARTSRSVSRLAFLSGAAGSVVMGALAAHIARYTFHDSTHTYAILALSPTIALVVIASGRTAVLQGLGRTKDLAKNNLVSSIIGVAASVTLITVFNEAGIVPAVIATSLATFFAGWWYLHKIRLPRLHVRWRESLTDACPMVQLGLAVMNAAFLAALVGYIARAVIVRDLNVAAAGVYICAYTLSGKLMGLIIDAMRIDFYPRLSAASHDPSRFNRVLNEQIQMSLLLTTPGLLSTMVFAPWLIRIFYTEQFLDACISLRVFVVGSFVSAVCGALRMVQLAKGMSLVSVATETATNGFHVALIYLLVRKYGVPGAAVAYVLHNLVQTAVSFAVARRVTGFTPSRSAACIFLTFIAILVAALLVSLITPGWMYMTIGGTAVLITSLFCIRVITRLLGGAHPLARFIAAQPLIGRLAPGYP